MPKQSLFTSRKISPTYILIAVFIAILLFLSAIFLWVGNRDSAQSHASLVAGVSFQGEYKIGDGDWHPIIKGRHIPATQGDITLHGFFQMHDPITNEPLSPLPVGRTVSFYLHHIGASIILPSGEVFAFDAESESLGEDACAIMGGSFTLPPTDPETPPESDPEPYTVTIVLTNPHRYGNENAVDDFLEHMSIAPGILHESTMLEKSAPDRMIGLTILISSLIILGIATFSTIIHIKYSPELWLIGLMSFFAGGYFFFDIFAVHLWNDSYITNTRALGLCMMLYMLSTTTLIVTRIKGLPRRVATGFVAVSAVSVLSCILLSFFRQIFFYDTWLYWALLESVVVLVLIVCLILSFRGAGSTDKFLYSISIFSLIPFPLDVLATGLGWWEGGLISKYVFLAVLILALVIVLRIIPSHINAAIKARTLEAEQQALRLELQESRISIMLSQMQPHFIFNTLNTIYHLCEINPEVARSTISSFSEYLRNNIDTLGQSEMISFEKELSFVKTYLDIEKVRFDDELEISFDIETTNFKLPVLTVQPLVENAVKHGTSKKKGVAQLHLSVRETDAYYEIKICDTGVGFDTSLPPDDDHKHIGISNVQQRLDNLCNGTLTIESEVGVGTTATVQIPKKEIQDP